MDLTDIIKEINKRCDEAYMSGMNRAWKLARDICGVKMTLKDAQVLERGLTSGDEVTGTSFIGKAIVVSIRMEEKEYRVKVMTQDGTILWVSEKNLMKTGNHYDVFERLKR